MSGSEVVSEAKTKAVAKKSTILPPEHAAAIRTLFGIKSGSAITRYRSGSVAQLPKSHTSPKLKRGDSKGSLESNAFWTTISLVRKADGKLKAKLDPIEAKKGQTVVKSYQIFGSEFVRDNPHQPLFVVSDTALGEGANGKVVLGLCICSNQSVAIKLTNTSANTTAMDDVNVERMNWQTKRGLKGYANFDSKDPEKALAVTVIPYFKGLNGLDFIYQECFSVLIDGENISKKKVLPLETMLGVALSAIKELRHISKIEDSNTGRGSLVHRDLKWDNVLVNPRKLRSMEGVHIIDLGSARDITTLMDPAKKEWFVREAKQLGTQGYHAPEILESNECNSMKTDIWSFGIMLAEMMTQYNVQVLFKKRLAEKGVGAEIRYEDIIAIMPDIFSDEAAKPLPKALAKGASGFERITYESESAEAKCWNKLLQIVQACTKRDPLERARDLDILQAELSELNAAYLMAKMRVNQAKVKTLGMSDLSSLRQQIAVPQPEKAATLRRPPIPSFAEGVFPEGSIKQSPTPEQTPRVETDEVTLDGLVDEMTTLMRQLELLGDDESLPRDPGYNVSIGNTNLVVRVTEQLQLAAQVAPELRARCLTRAETQIDRDGIVANRNGASALEEVHKRLKKKLI